MLPTFVATKPYRSLSIKQMSIEYKTTKTTFLGL